MNKKFCVEHEDRPNLSRKRLRYARARSRRGGPKGTETSKIKQGHPKISFEKAYTINLLILLDNFIEIAEPGSHFFVREIHDWRNKTFLMTDKIFVYT